MDVGNPSNMERLRNLFGEADELTRVLRVYSANDKDIEKEIVAFHRDSGVAVCPHTATALHAWHQLPDDNRVDKDWILVATAHPAKFESIVEPLIGETLPLPQGLAEIMSKPVHFSRIEPDLQSLVAQLDGAADNGATARQPGQVTGPSSSE